VTLDDDLAGAREATRRLLAHLDRLTVDELRAPSQLPGWTRSHVVAHLAGNAQSHVRMLDGCLAGEVRSQYPDDRAREAGIEALAAQPGKVVAAHAAAAAALEQRWSAMQPEHWDRLVRWLSRGTAPARTTVWSRWKEIEVHRVDLAAGYEPANWPSTFVERLLERLLRRTDLPDMVLEPEGQPAATFGSGGPRVGGPVHALTAWLSGRAAGDALRVSEGPLPELPPWA
jgi:maleylpyruvate isomerase